MNNSPRSYAVWLLAALLLGAGGLRAAENRPTTPSTEALTRFLLFSWVELPEKTPAFDISHRRLAARVVLRFASAPSAEVRQAISAKLEEPSSIERHRWASDKRLVIQLTSLTTDVSRLRPEDALREQDKSGPMLALGNKRNMPALPVWLYGEFCPYLFDGLEPHEERQVKGTAAKKLVATFCQTDSTVTEMAAARPPTDDRALTDLWRLMVYHKASELAQLDVGEFEAYINRHETTPQIMYFARISAAMIHAARHEFEACFAQLDAIERMDRDDEPVLTDWQRQLVSDLGEASFSRMVGRRLAAVEQREGSSADLLEHVERFGHWEGVTLPTPLKETIAKMYRQALFPKRAVPHYQALLERADADRPALLEELAETYYEADQNYRSWATLQYLREQHPERELTFVLDDDASMNPDGPLDQDKPAATSTP